jgi:glycosyltransferase involved in cell wall biosynthesis
MVSVSPPRLSVVICTYNRRALSARAVESLVAQTVDASEFEVVLVDNNSTDGTFEWGTEFARSYPSLRVFRETNQGLSFARNRGVEEARAPVVAFLDDDAVAVPEWVDALLKAFSSGPKNTVAVAGRIELEWSRPRPSWLPDEATGWLGFFSLSPERREMYPGKDNLRGGNMAVERKALIDVGMFDTRLGRSKAGLMGNEEVEFQRRLERLGRYMAYSHDAVIYHLVHPERLHRRWFLRRAYDQGRSDVRLEEALDARSNKNSLVGALGRTGYYGARALLTTTSSVRVKFALRAATATGALVEGTRR